jgi:hypothetical protein
VREKKNELLTSAQLRVDYTWTPKLYARDIAQVLNVQLISWDN